MSSSAKRTIPAPRPHHPLAPQVQVAHRMFRTFKILAAAAAMLLAGALGAAHAADVTPDDTAKFLAGMMPSADSPLIALTKDPAWQRHAKYFDSAFGALEERQMSKVRAWAEANVSDPKS